MSNGPFDFIEAWGVTDKGQIREQNQDAILVLPEAGLFVVADGVGGLAGGELASQTIVESLEKLCEEEAENTNFDKLSTKERALKLRLLQINDWLISQDRPEERYHPCSTLVLVTFAEDKLDRASTLHVGDSNFYRFRDDVLTSLITLHEDHHSPGNAISRAMGASTNLDLEHNLFLLSSNDYYLICSDGLYRMLSEQEIANVFREKQADGVKAITETLVEYANLAGGVDNISAVVLHVSKDHLPKFNPMDAETIDLDRFGLPPANDETREFDSDETRY